MGFHNFLEVMSFIPEKSEISLRDNSIVIVATITIELFLNDISDF